MQLTIIAYHYVRPIAESSYPGIKGLEVAQFESQLDYIESRYNVVSFAQALAASASGSPLPDNAAILTFDDGYKDHYRYAFPILRHRRLSGAFFPASSPHLEGSVLPVNKLQFVLASVQDTDVLVKRLEERVEDAADEFDLETLDDYRKQYWVPKRFDTIEVAYLKKMLQFGLPDPLRLRIIDGLFAKHVTKDEEGFSGELYAGISELTEMKDGGMEIGIHGHDHIWLGHATAVRQAEDIDRSMETLDMLELPRQGFLFCYPYGSYNEDTLEILRARNCGAAVTTQGGEASLCAEHRLELPRYDTNDITKQRPV